MKWSLVTGNPLAKKADALVVGVFEDRKLPAWWKGGDLSGTMKRMRFSGKAGEAFFAFEPAGKPAKHVLLVGLGSRKAAGEGRYRDASALAAERLRGRYVESAVWAFPWPAAASRRLPAVSAAVEGAMLGGGRFDKYITDEKARFAGLKQMQLIVPKAGKDLREAARFGAVRAEGTALARELVNEPANVLTPVKMAQIARTVARETGFKLKIYGPKQCESMGMGAYMAVARGSRNEPRLIHFSYRPKGAKARIALVGKGLTFDSGGISIKPGQGMGAMKGDMGGSAAVLGAVKALGALKPRVAFDAVLAMAENMPDGDAYRPGDILKSMSGKSIEIQNTDAEGRLALADALAFVQKQKPDAVIDLATLTGACVVGLGPDYAGAMGNDQKLMDCVLKAAEDSGDLLWQLPLPAGYRKYIKSGVADVSNLSSVRWGGAITAGLFLQEFIEEGMPWVHLDIAGPSMREDPGQGVAKGEGTGVGVRTLIRFVLSKE